MEAPQLSVQLEEILQLIVTHKAVEDKETFNDYKGTLPAELGTLLQEAVDMKWPFVEEKWQYKRSVESEDKVNTTELISKHLPKLMAFLRASIMAREPMWAMAIIFLLDRFLYWLDGSHTLLKIAKKLHRLYPKTPVAPQIIIRQARVYLNSGKLQKAEYILSSLINNSGATGCWRYDRDCDQVLVQAVSVQVRGQGLQKLGLWLEAAELIWASLIGFHVLPLPDKKGIGTSLGLLANILISMNDEDFDTFQKKPEINLAFLGECHHRLLCAAQAAKMAAVYSQFGSLYVLTHMVTQGTCLLSFSFSNDCPATEKQTYLSMAQEAFENGLLTKKPGEVVTSQQELHTILRAAYGLATAKKWLYGPSEKIREAVQSCQEAVSFFYSYCFQDDQDKTSLSSEVMAKIHHVKSLFNVKPFANSDPRSFIPDTYRAMEDRPVPFTITDFTKAIQGFQRHHRLVCEAFSGLNHKASGHDADHGNCITAFQTRTESLSTESNTASCTPNTDQPGNKGSSKSNKSSNPLLELHQMQMVDDVLKSKGQTRDRVSWSYHSYGQNSRSSSLSSSWGSMSFKSGSSLAMVDHSCCTEDDDGEPLPGSDINGCKGASNETGPDNSRSSSRNSTGVNESSTSRRPVSRTSIKSFSSSLGSSWQSISFSRSPLNGRLSVDQQCATEDPDSPFEYVNLQSLASPSLSRGVSQTGSDLSEPKDEQHRIETQSDGESSENPELCVDGSKSPHKQEPHEGNRGDPTKMDASCLSTEFEMVQLDDSEERPGNNMSNGNIKGSCAKGEELEHSPPEMPVDADEDQHLSSSTSVKPCTSCFQGCIMGSVVLKELDYKYLLSGVCQECLLKRLPNKPFQLGQYKRAYNALVLKYSKTSDSWTASETSVFVGDVLNVSVKGQQRQAFRLQYLHQELLLGSYVGKEYLKKRKIHKHLDDVERQMTAQFYVREFNKRLYENNITTQIFYIPAEILLLLEGDSIVACVSVEPYMLGEFVKLSNNTTRINPHHSATEYGIAFGHFTYEFSNNDEVVVDLQGWVTANGKGLVYLTDPQIHSLRKPKSASNFHQSGISKFLHHQHGEQCNSICRAAALHSLHIEQ